MEKNADKSGKDTPEHAKETAPVDGQVDMVETPEMHNQRLKERYYKKYGFEIINWEDLFPHASELATWLKELVRYGNVDSQVLIMRRHELHPETLDTKCMYYRCWIYTNDNRYTFSAHLKFDRNEKDYLGGYVETRKPRPGENWHRGNDLPDGEYSKETFDKIVRGIVAYEIKSLQLWRK